MKNEEISILEVWVICATDNEQGNQSYLLEHEGFFISEEEAKNRIKEIFVDEYTEGFCPFCVSLKRRT